MTPDPAPVPVAAPAWGVPGSVRRAVVGVLAAFALNGALMGAWGAALPGLRDRFDTDARGLAVLLVVSGLAAIVAMQAAGHWSDRSGARVPVLVAAPIMAVGLTVVAFAPTMAVAIVGAAVFGGGNGTMDVSMNTLAVHVERRRGRPVMSRFHAFFSIGSAAGAAVSALVGRLVADDVHVQVALLTVVALGLVFLAVTWTSVPQSEPAPHHRGDGPRLPLPRATWLLAAMAVCFGLTEGTGFDWSAVHVTDVAEVSPSVGALGLVAVSVFMVAIRLVGDHAVERFGHKAVVSAGSATAVVGYVVAIVGSGLPVLLAGWALVGLGVGMIAPQIYGTAGSLGGGRAMGVVVGAGYTSFLTGPAIIGAVADQVGIARAMLVPLVTGTFLVVMTRWMPSPRTADTTPTAAG
jgi:MFS family permease